MQILKTGICNKKEIRNLLLNNGFTLLELVLVIFILSIIMGLVMPSFYGIVEGRLKAETGRVASLLRYLNDNAIARKETFPLKINLNEKTLKWDANGGDKAERFSSLYSVSTTSTGDISEGEATLFFGPLGLQENLIVTLREKDREMSILFNHLSGRVKIIRNEK